MMNSAELAACSRVMQALAHPVRLGVLQVLLGGERSVSELYRVLDCSQSMMSQQLRILESQGLLRTRKEGTTKFCELRNPDFSKMLHCMENHLHSYLQIIEEQDG